MADSFASGIIRARGNKKIMKCQGAIAAKAK